MNNQEFSLTLRTQEASQKSPIHVKFPPFWTKNVPIWFHKTECYLRGLNTSIALA